MKVPSQSISLDVSNQGLAQQTQNLTSSEKFQQAMVGVTSALAGAAGAAAPFFPGGAMVSAALSGVSNMAQQAMQSGAGVGAFGGAGSVGPNVFGASGGGTPGMPGGGLPSIGGAAGGATGSPQSTVQQMANQNMYFLQLQQQTEQMNEQFTTLSNLMNVRHQTATSAIQNIH